MVSGCVLAVRGGLQAVRPWRFRNGNTGVRGCGAKKGWLLTIWALIPASPAGSKESGVAALAVAASSGTTVQRAWRAVAYIVAVTDVTGVKSEAIRGRSRLRH